MRCKISLLLSLLLVTTGLSQTPAPTPLVQFRNRPVELLDLSNTHQAGPENMTFITDKGYITISLKTGAVTIPPGMSKDAAAKEFWRALTRVYPDIKKSIKEQP